ncbi:hypothetical protein F6X40_17365 [Paraburkholderia sp. UCT31]|uniref:hypothetical protein n=1 Tax=Paraburkholderia sp. UCT31 TaxID=2615209 RepID=UPI00165598A0|nr:hypothetical protein [Paraburkholderia sp. UCT31]MBC8738531.1 hypothetical protein [Paraburkholderia sp. UCT31]
MLLASLAGTVLLLMTTRLSGREKKVAFATEEASQGSALVPEVLQVAGTVKVPASLRGFVTRFDIPKDRLDDVVCYGVPGTLSDMPDDVRELLRLSYNHGETRGLEVAEVLFKNRPLQVGEALYFALMKKTRSQDEEPTIYSFLSTALK